MRFLAAFSALAATTAVSATGLTPIHEPGRCAMRGQCGSKSFFGKQLPCVDNSPAHDPDAATRKLLVELCGPKWASGPVCCTHEQVAALKSEMGTPNQIVGSCPACKENFFNTFCTFTCSPDQSVFLNVTKSTKKAGKEMVAEVDQLLSAEYSDGFYDSCQNVKFGPANTNAMDFIGGGAKNSSELLKFLGDEKAIGSPFQINFPRDDHPYGEPKMHPLDEMKPRACNDEDPAFRCACVDCPDVCPSLAPVKEAKKCHVGKLPCLSFASILTYGILLVSAALFVAGRTVWRRRNKRSGLRLLQPSAQSDDEEDDDDIAMPSGLRNDEFFVGGRRARYHAVNSWCEAAFSQLGMFAARAPGITIGTCLVVVALLGAGWARFELETNPARLWVSPSSVAAQEKAFFDENFGPFYRAQQVFLANDVGSESGPVLSYDNLLWWMSVEKSITQLEGSIYGTRLEDVCFKPLGDACVVQSVTGYWQGEPSLVSPDSWSTYLLDCAKSPVECRPDYGQPLDPAMILGGIPDNGTVLDARALVVSWVLNNGDEDSPLVQRAIDFEHALRDRLLKAQDEAAERGLRLSFTTEASLEQELNKSTNTDAGIIVLSYLVMFVYVALSLGSTTLSFTDIIRNPSVALVQSKFTLAVAGIVIVLLSITASVGLFSWFGLKATLIIAEVIPFIVLAVGVDNIFLIVHEFDRVNLANPNVMVESRISKALGRIGPSILFSAITETFAFSLGATVGMPAVRNFAIYAAGAVFINAILQVTLFISVLSLNQKRVEDGRADCFPCIRVKRAHIRLPDDSDSDSVDGLPGPRHLDVPEESHLQLFIRTLYAPFLLRRTTKAVVLAAFLALFSASIALLPAIELGLDQRVALPSDSYLIPYFNDLYAYFDSGPPVYFVVRSGDITTRATQQQICARFTTCEPFSLSNILEGERKRSEVSYLASPTANWLDDFFTWLNPSFGPACCAATPRKSCFEDRTPAWNVTLDGMPEGDEFNMYLAKFLSAPTTEDCPLGGRASYGNAVVTDGHGGAPVTSHFRTAHTPLRSQSDFISAYTSARRIASSISASTGLSVFPYSVFYIFFDQYLYILPLTLSLLSTALILISVLTSLFLTPLTAIPTTLTLLSTTATLLAALPLLHIPLNAVTLVNLLISLGISLEFTAHISRAYTFPSPTLLHRATPRFPNDRDARVWTALVDVAGAVIRGITITKILGVSVLAGTRSKIFEIYYFRVWAALIVVAVLHALVLLPVLLSLCGGAGYGDFTVGGLGDGLEEDLARRRLGAFRDDDSDFDSDED